MQIPYSKTSIGTPLDGTFHYNQSPEIGANGTYQFTKQLPGSTDFGYYLPEWRKVVVSGDNATTDRVATKYRCKYNYGSIRSEFLALSGPDAGKKRLYTESSGSIGVRMADQVGFFSLPAYNGVAEGVVNGALTGFYKDVKNAVSQAQLLELTAEARQTARLLQQTGNRFVDSVRSFIDKLIEDPRLKRARSRRAGQKIKVKSKLRLIADRYLEFSFGLEPLAADIEGIAQALSEITIPPWTKVRAGNKKSTGGLAFGPEDRDLSGGTLFDYMSVEWHDRVTYKALFYGHVLNEQRQGLWVNPSRLGASMTDFVPTLWELIPYSFLVDYFTNLGEMITSRTGLRAYLGWVSLTTQEEYVRVLTANKALKNPRFFPGNPYSEVFDQFGGGVGVELTRKSLVRTNSPNIDLAFQYELPGLSSRKWLNLAALALSHTRLKTLLTLT